MHTNHLLVCIKELDNEQSAIKHKVKAVIVLIIKAISFGNRFLWSVSYIKPLFLQSQFMLEYVKIEDIMRCGDIYKKTV